MISEEAVLDIVRDAIFTMLICALPLLLVSLIVGLLVSIFQTVTSIQEQTLTFVPKILSIFVMLLLAGSWIANNLIGLMEKLWLDFSYYLSMG